MTSPRIEIDLDLIGDNARVLVGRAAERGVSVTGITKGLGGLPALGRVLLAAGVVALGDSRVENLERLRADGIDAPTVLVRSALASQVDRVVAVADMSCATEVELVELLSAAAARAGRVHAVMLMVELGDLREGIMPGDLPDAVARCLGLANIELRGIGANLACRNGVVPDDRNMGELSDLADVGRSGVRHRARRRVWQKLGQPRIARARPRADGRIDNLRLGRSRSYSATTS